MSKLIRIDNLQVARYQGYLSASQRVFSKRHLDVALEASLFDIIDESVTDEEIISEAYGGEYNAIERRCETTIEDMVSVINKLMSIARTFFRPEFSFAELLENDLREGYWEHLEDCFDYKHARVIRLGNNVPYVQIGDDGFTFILYAHDKSRCLLLVGNESD